MLKITLTNFYFFSKNSESNLPTDPIEAQLELAKNSNPIEKLRKPPQSSLQDLSAITISLLESWNRLIESSYSIRCKKGILQVILEW